MGEIADRAKLALDIAARLRPSAHGLSMQMKRKQAHAAPAAQGLSEVDESGLALPHKYLNQYESLKLRDPIAAQKFFNDWAIDTRPKPVDKHSLANKALAKLNQVDRPLRRRV